jgi:hypothetical protein
MTNKSVAVTEKGALVFSLTDFANPLRHLDIFLSPALSFDRLSKGANWFEIGGTKVRVASKELLIRIKNEIKPLRPKRSSRRARTFKINR